MNMFDVAIIMVLCVGIVFIALVPFIIHDRKEVNLDKSDDDLTDEEYLYKNPIDPMH